MMKKTTLALTSFSIKVHLYVKAVHLSVANSTEVKATNRMTLFAATRVFKKPLCHLERFRGRILAKVKHDREKVRPQT